MASAHTARAGAVSATLARVSLDDDAAQIAALISLGDQPIVLAIPPQGVALGEALARAIGAPFDVILARKVKRHGAPIAAIAEDGNRVIDERAVLAGGVSGHELDAAIAAERIAMAAQRERARGGAPLPSLVGRTVILVDDAIVTGLTARAAIAAVRGRGAHHVIVAALQSAGHATPVRIEAHDVHVLHEVPPAELAKFATR